MQNSKIEWCDHTFNPWIGCTKVSAGCANCYAERQMADRFGWVRWGAGQARMRTSPDTWSKVRAWDRNAAIDRTLGLLSYRPRVFCASLADWLDDEVEDSWRADLMELILETPELDWLLLTKRPDNWQPLMRRLNRSALASSWLDGVAPPNVWFGVSAENQTWFDLRTAIQAEIPAVLRFVSAEPLLGPIILRDRLPDWMIVGGESGNDPRPVDPAWIRSLRSQCEFSKVPFLFKQWGGKDKHAAGRELDGVIHNEFPNVKGSSK